MSMTIKNAVGLYESIIDMYKNDIEALKTHFLRLAFELSPQNEGERTESKKMAEAMRILNEEYMRTKDESLLRIVVTFQLLLEHLLTHPQKFHYAN